MPKGWWFRTFCGCRSRCAVPGASQDPMTCWPCRRHTATLASAPVSARWWIARRFGHTAKEERQAWGFGSRGASSTRRRATRAGHAWLEAVPGRAA
eukprot:4638415-Pyramimonas_sp.AAC.1